MTAAEVVACVRDLDFLSGLVRERVWNNDDQHVGAAARLAFHEAGRLFDSCAPKTCGTCADAAEPLAIEARDIGRWWQCGSATSSCSRGLASNVLWPATHGCPQWRRKEGSR